MEKNLKHNEIRERLTKRANKSLSQKIRWLTKKWASGKISAKELMEKENKLWDNLEREILKSDKQKGGLNSSQP